MTVVTAHRSAPRRSSGRSIADTIFAVLLVLVIAWSVLTFGAVYPWAYIPLLAGAVLTGAIGLIAGARRSEVNWRALFACLILVLVPLAQLVPVPRAALLAISPHADAILRQYSFSYAAGALGSYPLSIDPPATERGLIFLASFSVFLIGVASGVSSASIKLLTRSLLFLGSALALFAIVQRATFNGKLYWFWTPRFSGANAFGPFVNHNHFAGWLVMVLALTTGYLLDAIAHVSWEKNRDWRDCLLWLSSPEANRLLLIGFAILLMGIAVVFSQSRSGLISLLVMTTIATGGVLRHQPTLTRRFVGVVFLAMLVSVAIGWSGLIFVTDRFADTGTLQGRFGAWQDTMDAVRDFPLVGTGFNTYGTAMLFYQKSNATVHLAEAHSDYLQVLEEGGILLCAVALVALVLVARDIGRAFVAHEGRRPFMRWMGISAVAGMLAIAVQETAEFSLQIPANAALFCVLCAIALHRDRTR